MKEVRAALRAAMKNKALIREAAKAAAESHVRGLAYREADKMRAAAEAEEEAKEGEKPAAADNYGNVVHVAAAPAPRASHASPAAMAAAATGKRK